MPTAPLVSTPHQSIEVRFRALTGKKIRPNSMKDFSRMVAGLQKKWAEDIVKKVKEYPPPVYPELTSAEEKQFLKDGISSREIAIMRVGRTKLLYKSWKIDGPYASKGGLNIRILNDANERERRRVMRSLLPPPRRGFRKHYRAGKSHPYAQYVHGNAQGKYQTAQHAETGWKLLARFLKRKEYARRLQALIHTQLKEGGLLFEKFGK